MGADLCPPTRKIVLRTLESTLPVCIRRSFGLLQSILATLANLDFEHESDVETIGDSSADEWLKQTVIRKLQERHQQRRAPYIQQLERLQRQLQALAA
jgi:hypothetical protein